ncbi:hypothetical protein SISSUDRAFT_1062842 [Sistotremastrum suecicum HHB10207 ss-3]|uniref:DUF6533 domain-containing protein n=1 Tax=Sistotremastrum suecicum HHB10207 ss-3 TaxID=1314776 RepID=A0A166CF12_9AGAM|nr:hypothetical protein SISSUDRAFT_1062842 [Sistotremastrum suecicum HHB10207 ss-3]
MASLFQELETVLSQMSVSRNMAYSGFTVMIYDWVLTLPDEIKLIWPARWSTVRVIFLVNRYLLPLLLSVDIYVWGGFDLKLTPEFCKVWVTLESFVIISFFASLHWIVAMRAWALWGRSQLMGSAILTAFILYFVSTCVITGESMAFIGKTVGPIPLVNICFGTLPSYLWAIWCPNLVFETFIFTITFVKAWRHTRNNLTATPVLSVLYRDGFLYFVFISLASLMNLLTWAIAPAGYVLLAKYFTTSLCQVAGSRLILDLRAVGHRTGWSEEPEQSHEALTKSIPTARSARNIPHYSYSYELQPVQFNPPPRRPQRDSPLWEPPSEWQDEPQKSSTVWRRS